MNLNYRLTYIAWLLLQIHLCIWFVLEEIFKTCTYYLFIHWLSYLLDYVWRILEYCLSRFSWFSFYQFVGYPVTLSLLWNVSYFFGSLKILAFDLWHLFFKYHLCLSIFSSILVTKLLNLSALFLHRLLIVFRTDLICLIVNIHIGCLYHQFTDLKLDILQYTA